MIEKPPPPAFQLGFFSVISFALGIATAHNFDDTPPPPVDTETTIVADTLYDSVMLVHMPLDGHNTPLWSGRDCRVLSTGEENVYRMECTK